MLQSVIAASAIGAVKKAKAKTLEAAVTVDEHPVSQQASDEMEAVRYDYTAELATNETPKEEIKEEPVYEAYTAEETPAAQESAQEEQAEEAPATQEPAAQEQEQPAAKTNGYDYYNGKSFDPFIASLSDEERKQFTEIFILKYKGETKNLPDYEVGGDNTNFFRKVFIYLGQYREKIPSKLLAKMYDFASKK